LHLWKLFLLQSNRRKTQRLSSRSPIKNYCLGKSSNIIGSFFQSYPTTGGFSRTAVNDQAGAKTGMAALITAAIVAVVLMFFTIGFIICQKQC